MARLTAILLASAWLLALVAGGPSTAIAATSAAPGQQVDGAAASPALERLQGEVAEMKHTAEQPKPKDSWDKLGAVAALVSGFLVALIGGIATFIYNRQQTKTQTAQNEREMRLRKIETVQPFFPYLSGTDQAQKRDALLMIETIDPELAVTLANTYRDEASVSALSQIAGGGNESVTEAAREGLEGALAALEASVVQIGDPLRATGFIVRSDGIIATTDYVLEEYAFKEGPQEIDVVLPGDVRVKAEVLAPEPIRTGVAFLKAPSTELPALEIAASSEPRLLDQIVVMGATPDGMKVSVGSVVTVDTHLSEVPVPGSVMLAKLEIESGQGGAPVVDATGRVTGLVWGRLGQEPGATAILLSSEALEGALERLDDHRNGAGEGEAP